MSLTISEQRLKQAYEQQKKAYDLGTFCLKYGIEKAELQALAHEKLMQEEKEREEKYLERYEHD